MIQIPGHRVVEVLKEVPDDRLVMKTAVGGRLCVTRALLGERLDPRQAGLIRQVAMEGKGIGAIPPLLDVTLAGYRAAARLSRRPDDPWTFAIDAGVTAEGFAYISTRWIEGNPLHAVLSLLTPRQREEIAREVAHILARLHEHQIAYGDMKAENLIHVTRDRELSAGRVALIDLDTARIVPGPTDFSPTRALTQSWAAPEQKQGRSYLSSDLWAFGVLLQQLFTGQPAPATLGPLLQALHQPDPLRRPQTPLVYRCLCGEPGPLLDWYGRPTPPPESESTVRLPDATPVTVALSEQTDVMPDPPSWPGPATPPPISPPPPIPPVSPPPPIPAAPTVAPTKTASPEAPPITPPFSLSPTPAAPPAPIPSPAPDPDPRRTPSKPGALSQMFSGCMLAPLLIGGGAIAVCGGAIFSWDQGKVAEANLKAEATLEAMKAYKTDPALNSDRNQRARLRGMAEDAWQIRQTDRTGAVRALAVVWAEGWQDGNKRWNAAAYAAGEAAVLEAPDPREPEALLARASLARAACQLHEGVDGAAACRVTIETLREFQRETPASQGWLLAEGAWVGINAQKRLYYRSLESKRPDAPDLLREGLSRCAAAEPLLPEAPVNGIELMEDCLEMAGRAQDLGRYFRFSDWLLAQGGGNSTQRKLFEMAGEGCEKTPFRSKSSPDPSSKADPWCAAIGYAATDRWDAAIWLLQQQPDPPPPGRPWAELETYLRQQSPDGFVKYDQMNQWYDPL